MAFEARRTIDRAIFEDFVSACGRKAIDAAYGPSFPRPLLPWGDYIYEYRWCDARVAWGRITPHPEERAVFIGLGVWPDKARQSWRLDVRAHLAHVAFHEFDEYRVERAMIGVLSTNQDHFIRCLRESEHGPWKYSGMVWHPAPGYALFTLAREDFGRLLVGQDSDGQGRLLRTIASCRSSS